MSTMPLLTDARVRSIEWKDLKRLSRAKVLHELIISLPWLLGSLAFYYYEFYILGFACAFMFFLTGLRQTHNAHHYALGIPRFATEWVMTVLRSPKTITGICSPPPMRSTRSTFE